MRHKGVAFVATGLITAVLAAGCSSGGEQDTQSQGPDFSAKPSGTLKAWGFNNADDVGKARLEHAKGQLSGVTIEMDQTGFDAQKFTTRVASGSVPDVVQMDRQYVATYAAQNLIIPLDRCYSDNKVDPKQRFYASVVGDVTYQNKIWAVPQFFQPPAIMINKKLTAAAGVSDSEFDTSKPDTLLSAITKLYKQNGGVPTTLGFNPVATGQPNLWVLGLGGKLTDDNGAPTLDDPSNVYPLETLKKILDAQGGFAKVKSFSDAFDMFGEKNQFVTDQVAAEVDAQWYPNVLAPYKDRIQVAAVPFKDKSGKTVTVAGGTAFVIPANAANPAAACAWMLALTSPENWMAAADARAATVKQRSSVFTGLFTGSPDADKAIRDKYVTPSGNAGFDQVVSTYYDVVASGRSFGASPAGQQIHQELLNAITATGLGTKSAQQALADAQVAAKRAYDTVVRK